MIGVGVVLEIALALLIYPIVAPRHNQSQDVVKDLDEARGVHLALIALVAGLVAPVCEELLFRGLLLRALRRRVSPVRGGRGLGAGVRAGAPACSTRRSGTFAVVPALFALGAVSGVVAVRRGDCRCRSCCTSGSTCSPRSAPCTS